jgi:hypothetical protein
MNTTKLLVERGKRFAFVFSAIGITVLGVAIYSSGLAGPYFGDDFQLVFQYPSAKYLYFFTHANPNLVFYRPIQSMIMAMIQSAVGLNTVPVHVLTFALHLVLSVVVFVASRRLGLSPRQGFIASLIMVISQANAMAVLSNDSLSQVAGTLCGYLSVLLFYIHFDEQSEKGTTRVGTLAIVLFALSLWCKESSLCFLPIVVVVALAGHLQHKPLRINPLQMIVQTFPFGIVTLVYVVLRSFVVQRLADSRYSLEFGTNVIKNILLLLSSCALPVSSAQAFQAYSHGDLAFLIVAAGLAFLFLALVMYGLLRSWNPSILVLLLIAVVSLFPMVLFRHVSELYAYNTMPPISILMSIGIAGALRQMTTRRLLRGIAMVLLCACLVGNSLGVYDKGHAMTKNGIEASRLLDRIEGHVASVPPGGYLILLNPPDGSPEYSVFYMNGFNVLEYGTNIIKQMSNREDMQIVIGSLEKFRGMTIPTSSVVLTLKGDSVRVFEPALIVK